MAAAREESVTAFVAPLPDVAATIEAAVRAAMELHGPSLLFDVECLRDTLLAVGPGIAREREWLLDAQGFEVPQQLLAIHGDDIAPRLETLAARLAEARGMAPAAAAWAVSRWARILDVGTVPPAAVAALADDTADDAADDTTAGAAAADADAGSVDRRHTTVGTGPTTASVHARSGNYLGAAVIVVVAAIVAWFGFFQKSLAIADVSSPGALVADGSEHDVVVAFDARRAPVRRVEVQAVGTANAPVRVIDVGPGSIEKGRVRAGRVALRSDAPGRLTYRYVLVSDDRLRSAPFDKTFEFAPGPARPPLITSVSVPTVLVAGKPFAVDIAYAPGSRPIAQVEMRVASSNIPWSPDVASIPWAASAPGSPPVMRYPFDSGLKPSRTTLDFTMIDANGFRSAPERVVLDVRKPTVVATCTPTTCGRVVTTRDAEPSNAVVGFFRRIFSSDDKRQQKVYEVVVRRDDGTMHVLNDTRRWNAGARVRIVGNRVSLHCLDVAGRCT